MSDYEINIPLEEFRNVLLGSTGAINRDSLHFYASHGDDGSQKIFVYFSDERNVGVSTMRKFLQKLEEKDIGRGIIIFPDKMTASAHKVCVVHRLLVGLAATLDTPLSTALLMLPSLHSPSPAQVIDAMRAQFELEDFHEVSLLVNITRHHLVPRHEVLSEEDKKALLSR